MRVMDKLNSQDEESESGEKIIQETIPSLNPSIINIVTDDIHIKQEYVAYVDVGFHHNSTGDDTQDEDLDHERETESTIPHIDCSSVQSSEKDVNGFYLVLVRCKEGCETCIKYMRVLSEHVRTTHAHVLPQPIQDPLLIDPLHIDLDPPHAQQSSSVQIKCEVEETIEKMECFEEESNSTSDPDFDLESESDSDPDYSAPYHVTRNVRRQGQGSNKNPARKDSKRLKADVKVKIVSTREGDEEKEVEVFKCSECNKSFSQQIYLKAHMRVHTSEHKAAFKCKECKKSFSSKGSLTTHMRVHSGEKPFQCDQCEKSFTQSSNLNMHKQRHHRQKQTTGKKLFKCDLCDKSFFKLHRLTEHQRSHTGEKPFKCEECKDRSFTTSYEYVRHKKIHKIFKCKWCEKTFKNIDHLIEHRKRIHSEGKPFKCDECEKCFPIKSSLDKHKRQTSHGRKTVQV